VKKFAFLINSGRANVTWQSSYLDQDNEFVTDRMPYPYMEMNPKDMDDLKLKAGDLIEVYNDNGSTQAMVYPAPSAKQEQTFMIFQVARVQGLRLAGADLGGRGPLAAAIWSGNSLPGAFPTLQGWLKGDG
jgi:arsenite oxidase large subunit